MSGFRFQISGFRFQISGFRFQFLDFRFQFLDFRFQVSGFRFQISGFSFQISDFRFQIYGDPVVSENITYGARGAEGIVSYEYNVQVSKYGDLLFPATTVSYFDPKKERYVQVETEENTISVTPDESFITSEPSEDENMDEAFAEPIPELRKKKEIRTTDTLYGSPVFWSGVSVPLLCAFFFLIFTRRREQSADKIEARQVIKQKDKELGDHVAKSKSLIATDPNGSIYFCLFMLCILHRL